MKQILLIFLLSSVLLFAQEEKKDPNLNKWIPSLTTGLNISQISFQNWAKGGENSFAYTLKGEFGLNYKNDVWGVKNSLKASFGRTKLGDKGNRTTDNDLYLESVFSYQIGWDVDPFFSNSIRSAITSGYEYKNNDKHLIADFFDPGYLTQSIGFTYSRLEAFQTRIGIAFQETFASTDSIAQRYIKTNKISEKEYKPIELIDYSHFETGIESVTDANFDVAENVNYKGQLRLFTRFENIDIWDVRFDNTITAKVNSWLNVNLTYLVIHEISQTLRTQSKEALQIGITYKFI